MSKESRNRIELFQSFLLAITPITNSLTEDLRKKIDKDGRERVVSDILSKLDNTFKQIDAVILREEIEPDEKTHIAFTVKQLLDMKQQLEKETNPIFIAIYATQILSFTHCLHNVYEPFFEKK